jgi:hypothetical protein
MSHREGRQGWNASAMTWLRRTRSAADAGMTAGATGPVTRALALRAAAASAAAAASREATNSTCASCGSARRRPG